jgi:2-polyprenyl-3-methyl-5-hydroxy-6-metoxy-1,4-benzoquinol methylase
MAQIYKWDLQGFRDSYSKYVYIQKECGQSRIQLCKCTGRIETYSRKFFSSNELFRLRATNIALTAQMAVGSTVLVAGAAFGFLMEEFEKLGMHVYGFDNSQYIHQQIRLPKNPNQVQFSIHNIDLLSSTFTTQIQLATGRTHFDFIITEDLLTSHDTFDVITHNCESVLTPLKPKSNIIHLIDLTPGLNFTKKSEEEWVNVEPSHSWVNMSGEILNGNN